jgi:alkylhydroperoxidase family enzyme
VDTPGITPIPPAEWSEDARQTLPRFLRRPELYLPERPDAAPMPQALRLFAHHVELGAAWMTFNEMLIGPHATLDTRTRELAILRVAWSTGSRYEWKQHVRMGKHAGLSTEQLYAVAEGPGAPSWTPFERAILAAADEIVEERSVRAETWKELSGQLDPAQILELTFVIGAYLCFAVVTNAARLQPDPPTEEVDAPELPARPD